nr:squamosa promoter-binding-like protein 7 [Ipomoea batatas]
MGAIGSDPDPLVVPLNLSAAAHQGGGVVKRSKSGGGGEARCQVEGCKVGLENAKGYHRKHKVCEMHAKAPKVLLLGHQQRFCQQCSRFHAVSEFDETKRSCRRRLAGHNERRRKNSQHSSTTTKSPCHDYKVMMGARRYEDNKGAQSLLSTNNDFLVSAAADLPAAAFYDLIGESRAAILGSRHTILHPTHSDYVVRASSIGDFGMIFEEAKPMLRRDGEERDYLSAYCKNLDFWQ